MRPSLPAALLPICLVLATGCANMMNKGRQSLTLSSDPPGAIVYENSAEVGTTPYVYTYDRTDGEKVTLELRKEGYAHRTFEITPAKANGILLVDALLLNIPYYAGDAKSSALYTFPRKEFKVNLYRAHREDVRKVDLPVVTLENRVADRDRLGHVGSKKIGINSREADDLEYPDQLTSAIVSALRPTWANAGIVRLATQKGDETVRSTKYYLKPVLRSLDMDLEEVDDKLYGTVRSSITWTFMSGLVKDSVLFTIERDNNYPVFHEAASEALANAIGDAAHRLVDEEGLADRLGAVFTKGLSLSKGTQIELRTPKPIPFTGRKDMLSALVKGVVTIETSDGHGSGFLLTHDGHVLTNAHVVGDDAKVKVRFQQGFTLEGVVEKVNRDFDVALVKTPGEDLPALTLGVDTALQLGEELFAIGTPLDKELGQTVTRGIMSGMRTFEGRTFLQTDVPINPGNSGGPLIDETGKVVGVATLKISDGGVQGIGFGVPISKAIEMLNITFTP